MFRFSDPLTLSKLFLLAWATQGLAQSPMGEIRIDIQDPLGASVDGLVKISGPANRSGRASKGQYIASGLPVGKYSLEVSQSGFTSHTERIDLAAGASITRHITLSLAAASTQIEVAATMPLPGIDLPLDQIPIPVQTATQADLAKSGATDLADFLNRRINGVHLNEMQGNPFQADVNFRGYTASPLLGTPQGLSVFLDGVRQNQPFGDVVSWDLIPENAISSMTLIPGSDPLFGLNTLGGALAIQTKDGASDAGTSIKLLYGSSGRKSLQAEQGGSRRNSNGSSFNWFFSANAFHETGWRFDSPSDVRQGFGKLGWKTESTNLALSLVYAYNTLTGNGLQDSRLLAQDWRSVYTVPDTTGNRSPSIALNLRHALSSQTVISGNIYYRNIRTEGVNGNLNTNSLDQSLYQPSAADQAALKAAGYTGYPTNGANASDTPFPYWRCIAQALEFADPSARCDALTVYSKVVQNNYGFAGQVTKYSGKNQITVGASYNRSNVGFTQNTQFGYLNPNRSITGVASWADGSTSDSGAPVDDRVRLDGIVPDWSVYASDSLSVGNTLHFSFSGRFNHNTIHNSDRLNPGGSPGSLDAHDVFVRFNPSIGATWSLHPTLNVYGSFNQGSRAPTSIELGCADPANPCNLPNALASDPPLKQVVTTTWEAGLRGKLELFSWNAGLFRAENRDDILFVASQQTGAGYFKNFGRTRRQGAQADFTATAKKITAGIDYTFLDATYESSETVDGSSNSTNSSALAGLPGIPGIITINPGNRIPLTPRHTGKFFTTANITSRFSLDAGLIAASKSYARGNENNLDKPDGKYYLGSGISGGYAVVNFGAHYDLSRRIQFVVRLDNVLDRRYYTAGQLNTSGFTAQGTFIARPFPVYKTGDYALEHIAFYAPGAPRRVWMELRLRL